MSGDSLSERQVGQLESIGRVLAKMLIDNQVARGPAGFVWHYLRGSHEQALRRADPTPRMILQPVFRSSTLGSLDISGGGKISVTCHGIGVRHRVFTLES